MSRETQSRLRIVVPGVMLLVYLILLLLPIPLTIYDYGFAEILAFLTSLGPVLPIIVSLVLVGAVVPLLGSIYRIAGFRKRLLKKSQHRINENIKDRLLVSYVSNSTISESTEKVRQKNALLNVFWDFVDNKESLKDKAKGVRLNGLFWSSVADAMAVSILCSCTSIVIYLIVRQAYFLVVVIVALLLYALCRWLLMPLVVGRHIVLGNEQVEFIIDLHESELRSRLEELARSSKS